jgi:hypothetical protein
MRPHTKVLTMNATIVTLAHFLAVKEIKRQLQAQKLKLTHVTRRS